MKIYQNDLDPSIAHIACYFTSIASAKEDYEWTAQELNEKFFQCKTLGYIDEDNCIAKPQYVANVLETGLTFIGKFYTDYVHQKNDVIIGCWKVMPSAKDAHFVLMNNNGVYTRDNVSFDPWEGGSNTCRIGLCTSLRVFRRGANV